MSAVEYRAILRHFLIISLFSIDEVCPVYRKACLDTFGEHAIHCKELLDFKYIHDIVRDVNGGSSIGPMGAMVPPKFLYI